MKKLIVVKKFPNAALFDSTDKSFITNVKKEGITCH
jgi:hypothetical protein